MIFASQLLEKAKANDLAAEDLLIEANNMLEEIDHDIPCFNTIIDAPSVIQQSKDWVEEK